MKKIPHGECRNCKKCGVSFAGRYCKECQKARSRDARALALKDKPPKEKAPKKIESPEAQKARFSRWYAKNKAEFNANRAKKRIENPPKYRPKKKYTYMSTPESRELAKLKARAFRAANPEIGKRASANWYSKNKKYHSLLVQNREAKKRANGGGLSKGLQSKLFALQKGKCACCGQPLGDDYHMDHIMPIALGGSNVDSNIQLLRRRCNLQKSAKHPVDFMQERGFLL
jgi:5-methylcytosine-specific restriction endonuclease McrA